MKVKVSKEHSRMKNNIKLNPFEVHINRSKHLVLGRKLKSDKGMPGISKHKAFKKRKDTLLQEYKMRHKTNHFIDQRIGERNSGMTEDDKIMARFTAERMRMFNKKTMFNLSDSEVLTHRGQTLSEIERFENTRSDDEEDDPGSSGALKGKFVGDAHFGGGTLTKSKQNRESLIDELINESKKRKAERQRNKEETLEATEKLDEEWKILGQITTSAGIEESIVEPSKKTRENDYDVVMRQLKFEPHGQASQRLKTDEEIAKEDKEKLEKLEHERLKQLREMESVKYGNHRSSDDIDDGFSNLTKDYLANDDDSDDNSESPNENDMDIDNVCSGNESSDSSLEDNGESNQISDIKIGKEKNNLNKINLSKNDFETRNDEEHSENILGQEDDLSSGCESSDESSLEESAMEDLSDLMPSVNEKGSEVQHTKNVAGTKRKDISKGKRPAKESSEATNASLISTLDLNLPYILDVPTNFESFRDLLNKHSIEEQNIILERLLKSNHPSLDPANKKKMLKLADFILQFVNEEDFVLDSLPNMILHFSILKEFNKEECLNLLIDDLSLKVEDFNGNNVSQCSTTFIIWYAMLFLKPQGIDILLPINKPALSVLSSVVSKANVSSKPQLIIGILYSYLLLLDAKSSSALYIDAIVFLQNCLASSLSDSQDSKKTLNHMKNDIQEDFRLNLKALEENDNHSSTQIMYLSLTLLADYVKTYRKYPQSKILFRKIYTVVSEIDVAIYPMSLQNPITELKTLLEILQTASLPPVVKASKKPKALRQYEPSFHVITEGKRSFRGLPFEKQEEQKLLHKYKSEMKGAMRELRRDRVFLANVKLGEKARSDAERIKKVKEIFGAASAQQGELRSLKRKK